MSSNDNIDTSSPIIRRRKLLTLKTKINIIKKHEDGKSISQISRDLNLPVSTVRTIVKDKKRIIAASKGTTMFQSSTIIRKRHAILAQVECALKKWCEEQAKQNIHLTRNAVCTQARSLFDALKKDYGEAGKNESFLASNGWYFRFKQRCEDSRVNEAEEETKEDETSEAEIKVEMIKDASQVDDLEVNTMSPFTDYLKTIIEEGGYTAQSIFNVDEIGLYWKKMPMISYQCENNSGFNESKDRLTLLLGGNAAGDLKLKPLVIYRIDNPKALQSKSKAGLPVIWKSNSKASMTASMFEDWFGHYFIPEVERYCYANKIPCKVLLIIDSAVYHPPTTLIDFDHRVKVIFLPPGQAYSNLPMCQEMSTLFKATYTRGVLLHLIENCRANNLLTVQELWKEFNILDAIRIIVDSWDSISDIKMQKSWVNICPFLFYTKDPTVENETCGDITEEIINLALELELKVDRKDISDLLDSHSKELTIEEVAEMQEYSSCQELDSRDPLHSLQQGKSMTAENLMEAISHIKIGLHILETIDTNEQRARITRLGVMKLLNVYEVLMEEKTKATVNRDE